MEEKDKISKMKKSLICRLLLCLIIAFACIGFGLFKGVANKNREAVNVSELVLNDGVEEQYVSIDVSTDTYPVAITPYLEDIQLYYVTDTSNQIYIVDISDETLKNMSEMWNAETGKFDSVYQIKGIANTIDEKTKKIVINNSFQAIYSDLNSDNFSDYFSEIYIKDDTVSEREVTVRKIIVFVGVFFLVLGFAYTVPALVKANKGDFGILDDKKMKKAFEPSLPLGEVLRAGVHAIGIQTEMKQVFGKCELVGDNIVPNEDGTTLMVTKSKSANYDVYLGITQNHLLIAECETYKHLYEFNDLGKLDVEGIDSCIPIQDIGTCFSLAEIEKCEIKKIWMGAVNCSITLKNGSFLKFMIPKSGGAGMPRHAEYRDTILACLSANHAGF